VRVPSSMAGAEQPYIDDEGGVTYIAANREGWFSLFHLAPGSTAAAPLPRRAMYAEGLGPGLRPGPAVTADGRTVVFVEMTEKRALFKVDIDGSNVVKLADPAPA